MLTLSRLAALFGIAISMGSATTASAGTQCPQHFYGGREPTLMNQRLTAKARELCYTSFVSYHSGLTRTPLYSAEHLVREHIQEARDMEREDSFHPDPNLPYDERSELADFRGSGWDRGHLSPNGDMPDTKSQGESFTLGNMIPQAPDNNRKLWAAIEGAVRNLAVADGEVYVVTGPIFHGSQVMALKGRVLIPTYVYKAIYDPSKGVVGAYVTRNAPGGDYEVLSLSKLERLTGIRTFPSLPQNFQDAQTGLPAPASNGRNRSGPNTGSLGQELEQILGN